MRRPVRFISAPKIQGRAWLLYQQSWRRNPAPAEDPRPIFVNLSILSHMLPGHMMADVVAILGSLDFVMGECDR